MAGKVAIAFILVIAAGACTCLGAGLAFFAKLTNRKCLAASLAGAAGVMTYISLVEILPTKSVRSFANHLRSPPNDPRPLRYATLCFFGGITVVYILDQVVHIMMYFANIDTGLKAQGQQAVAEAKALNDLELGRQPQGFSVVAEDEVKANELLALMPASHRKALAKMGLLNMLAVGIHNLPEGLVTFVGYYNNPRAGVALAVAVALHNIPEGVVVGMPIYFATGSRTKAFIWTAISGLFEVIGGIVGYLIVKGGDASPVANAIMFGLVSGIMVYISMKDLLPTALKYDPENQVSSNSFLLGVAVMAVSLILLGIRDA